ASVRFAPGSRMFGRLVRPLQDKVMPTDDRELGQTRRKLLRAGWYSPQAVPAFYVARLLCALALPLAFNLLGPLFDDTLKVTHLALGSGVLALVGYAFPALLVSHRIAKRQIDIRGGFPDALDLLLVCVEAGLGLDAAINRVAQEIGTAHPLLREQFRLMALELQTGKSREQALRSFSDRIGLDEVNVLATLLIQSDALGASVADTLRALSDDMRAKRMLRAEEKAQQTGVKLTFPLILLIMPALMLTIGAPAIIQVIRQVGPVIANMGNG
ncbi:MAG TPA: type II secretion system F family protein, partial [Magnetospirillum sp.]|nr:type II secretion system F family protein [Magnetospirillum sp.]